MDIKITNLSKKYLASKIKCLNDINVLINEGVYGLLGENGAGKTSLLKTIATILPIQTGNIQVYWHRCQRSYGRRSHYVAQQYIRIHRRTTGSAAG